MLPESCVLSVSASEIMDSGTCGSNLTWTLDDAGKRTVTGTGAISGDASFVWNSDSIGNIVIGNGVTSMEDAFTNCRNLTSVTIPGNVETIGARAFLCCQNLTDVTISQGVKTIGEAGAATATLSISAKTVYNGYRYRCIVTDGSCARVTSSTAQLTVQ